MEIKKVVTPIRKKINNKLRSINCIYNYSTVISQLFCGEGFYVNHKDKVLERTIRIWGYDKHWAYGGALKNNIFPLSSVIGNEKTELAFHCIEFSYIKPRYKEFNYTLYRNNIIKNGKNNLILLTSLDYEIFTDIYETDAKILYTKYFQHVGKLEILNDLIDEYYIKKKQDDIKTEVEACFYGLFAKKLKRKKYTSRQEELKFIEAYAETGFEDIRNEQTPIALWQTAYLRYEEWQQFKKYKDNVIYMNTDSIYTDKEIDIECKNEIGHYDIEYKGMLAHFIRRNAYIILNDDETLYKQVISGVISKEEGGKELTKELIQDILDYKSVILSTRNEDKEIIDIEVSPLYVEERFNYKINKFSGLKGD